LNPSEESFAHSLRRLPGLSGPASAINVHFS
jgi:hypothetical protein